VPIRPRRSPVSFQWHAVYTNWPANLPQAGGRATPPTSPLRYDVAEPSDLVGRWQRETDSNVSAPIRRTGPVGYVGCSGTGNGDIYLDDLKVVLVIKPAITPSPPDRRKREP